ncbi:glycerate kinase [Thermoleptolyngbya sp. PKUAC-SCTB121]|uniref:glycerate kinase n=1 Tax=Thermoleptolyngbya sp. PKUAC-SCTB121 TaxID=2811482 RepID=UPI0019649F06|nr:glycerate kinase [Thermoleptolyngbya sp. PKUAC-SCTB121]
MATQNAPFQTLLAQLADEPFPGQGSDSSAAVSLAVSLLRADWLARGWRPEQFGLADAQLDDWMIAQAEQFRQAYRAIAPLCQDELGWDVVPLDLLWGLWLPLAEWLKQCWRLHSRPLIQGILGGQGTGKSTLARLLRGILAADGLRVVCLSIDDLYKTWGDRQQLQQADPRLRWRGPPGTHDVDLGIQTLQALRQGKSPVLLPRFDKSLHQGQGDRTAPEPVSGADLVLFEGWFVGLRPIDSAAFDDAPLPILTAADRAFARDCNTRLADYLPLWNLLDGLIVLRPDDYRLSQQWRKQAEHRMAAAGRPGMSDAEIDQFVEYFWRSLHPALFYPPLLRDSEQVDWVVEVRADRQVDRVWKSRGNDGTA